MASRSTRRPCFVLVALALWVVSCGETPTPEPTPKEPRHLVIVSIDTLNHSALRAFDPDAQELPALDRFARSARRFEHAYSTASWTLPAHASLFTGLYSEGHGAVSASHRLAEDLPTLAECARENGFQTRAYTDGGYLSADYGVGRGFEIFRDEPPVPRPGPGAFDDAIRFLETRQDDRPLLLFAHTYMLHDYFEAHPWTVAELEPFDDLDGAEYLACLKGETECSPEIWQRLRDLYDAETRAVDRASGDLLAALDEAGIAEETLVVVLSDHGEGFDAERERIHHGGRLHADLLRVPLLVAGPGVEPGRESVPASVIDLLPTFEEIFGWQCGGERHGLSLAPALAGEAVPERTLFASDLFYRWHRGQRLLHESVEQPLLQAAIAPDGAWLIATADRFELYDMNRDPRQHDDLAKENEVPTKLVEALEKREGLARSEPLEIDDELREKLEALGYL